MSSRSIIRVENLSKQYRIAARKAAYGTLRDKLAEKARTASHRFQRNGRRDEETIWALRNVSFEVEAGEVLGIIGRNGAGKSTLLKILSRVVEPTSGQVELFGRVGSLLEVGTGFHGELSGRENVFLNGAILGMRRSELARKFDEIVDFAEVEKFIDTPVKHYSSGMYMRLAFAVAAHLETEILLVDEVLAVGDSVFQRKCLGKMGDLARAGRTVLFVSHSLAAVSRLCEGAMLMEGGGLTLRGATADVIDRYYSKVLTQYEDDTHEAHVIYDNDGMSLSDETFSITKVELLDTDGNPKSRVFTWDNLKIRVWYSCKDYLKRGCVVLQIASVDGRHVLLLSTEPDGTLPMKFEPGLAYADCLLKNLPLSAGAYVVGAGLAIPNVRYLWKQDDLGILTVNPKDVYESGLSPLASRSLIAVEHEWTATKA